MRHPTLLGALHTSWSGHSSHKVVCILQERRVHACKTNQKPQLCWLLAEYVTPRGGWCLVAHPVGLASSTLTSSTWKLMSTGMSTCQVGNVVGEMAATEDLR